MYLVLTVGGKTDPKKGAREGAALEFFFFALWATICKKMSCPHLYLLIVVLETARLSVAEALQTLVSTFMPSVLCSTV